MSIDSAHTKFTPDEGGESLWNGQKFRIEQVYVAHEDEESIKEKVNIVAAFLSTCAGLTGNVRLIGIVLVNQ